MNKRSVRKKRPTKATENVAVRKASSVRKTSARRSTPKPEPISAIAITSITSITALATSQVAARLPILRTHKFRVGQTVSYTSSPITRPGASGSYKVVRLLPSDGEDYQYRIKNPGEAFERVAKESQLELEH